jgi:aspartokinase-like uncharacterized kinase
MWVLKLGGSLARSPALPHWLAVLSEQGGGRVILVPGGGPFADGVRQLQQRWRFADVVAHHMALLAMEQYGLMLAGIEPRLIPARNKDRLLTVLHAGHVPVWLPAGMAGTREDIPATWETSSDSLAAWLTLELQADCLILVKAVAPKPGKVWVDELCARGIVDAGFSSYLVRGRYSAWWLGSADYPKLAQILKGEKLPGAEILATPVRKMN